MTTKHSFKEQYGPWAIVTGASSGIGAGFARQLAQKGLNLVLVARREPLLQELGQELEEQFGIKAIAVALDLTQADFISTLKSATQDLEIGLVINNAATWGDNNSFLDNAIEDELRIIDLNMRAPLILTHHFVGLMRQRNKGGVIFVSSAIAPLAAPGMANYMASKAYDLVFAKALHHELKGTGLDVLILCPGLTRTKHVIADLKESVIETAMPVSDVVSATLDALGTKVTVTPGIKTRIFSFVLDKFLPRQTGVALIGKQLKKMKA